MSDAPRLRRLALRAGLPADLADHVDALLTIEHPTATDLHAMLDDALQLRDHCASGHYAAVAATYQVVQHLLDMAFGRLAAAVINSRPPQGLAGVRLRRRQLEYGLRLPSLMPETDRAELRLALAELDAGTGKPPPLLAPFKVRGRGDNPLAAMEIEKMIWHWIWLEHACNGEAIGSLTALAAKACNVTPGAVEKWREAWQDRETPEAVVSSRASVVRLGQAYPPSVPADERLRRLAEALKRARAPAKVIRSQRKPK